MPRPPRPLTPTTAARLQRVAARAFAEHGLDGASLNAILRETQMAKSSFYHRFTGKNALHDWVAEQLAAELLRAIVPPIPDALTADSFRPELMGLLGRFTLTALAQPELADLGRMFHNSAALPADRAITAIRANTLGWIQETLRTGSALGVIRRDVPMDLLTALTVAYLGALDQWVLSAADAAPRAGVAAQAIDLLWSLLTGEGELPDPSTPDRKATT